MFQVCFVSKIKRIRVVEMNSDWYFSLTLVILVKQKILYKTGRGGRAGYLVEKNFGRFGREGGVGAALGSGF